MNVSSSDAELAALIERVGLRDEAALRLLYERSSARLYGLALRVVRERAHAEDVLQETFLTIWRVAGDYRAALSPPMAWLTLIVRSRALDLLRRRAADGARRTDAFDEALADTLAADTPTPADLADASEQARALHHCLSQLEKRQREVISIAYLRELSHGELAQQLSLPLGTVKTWIRRGLEKLRACMAPAA